MNCRRHHLLLPRLLVAAACGALTVPLLLTAACGGGESGTTSTPAAGKPAATLLDEAAVAIEAEEWAKAITSLDAVIADGKATAEEKTLAWIDKITAESCGNGDDAGKAAFKNFLGSGIELTGGQFASLGNNLVDKEHPKVALDVIEAATLKYGTDKAIKKKLKSLAKRCQESASSEELDKLKSLGYLSSEDDEEEDEEGDS